MCGIGALLQPSAVSGAGFAMGDEHLNLLARRGPGPDVQRTMQLPLQIDKAGGDGMPSLFCTAPYSASGDASPLPQPLLCGRCDRKNACASLPLKFTHVQLAFDVERRSV
jgi:hypothetical protein